MAQRNNVPIIAIAFNLHMGTDYSVRPVCASNFMARGCCFSCFCFPKRLPRRIAYRSRLSSSLNVLNSFYRHISNRPPLSLRPYCSPSLGLNVGDGPINNTSNIVPSINSILKIGHNRAISDNRTDRLADSIWKYRTKLLTLHR